MTSRPPTFASAWQAANSHAYGIARSVRVLQAQRRDQENAQCGGPAPPLYGDLRHPRGLD